MNPTSNEQNRMSLQVDEFRNQMITKINYQLQGKRVDDTVQKELAKLIDLINDERVTASDQKWIECAIERLLDEPPDIVLAANVREDINVRIRSSLAKQTYKLKCTILSPFSWLTRSASPGSQVVLGLGAWLYIAVILLIYGFVLKLKLKPQGAFVDFLTMHELGLCLVCTGGAIGSFASMMIRFRKFDCLENVDRLVLFFIGFFNPSMGVLGAIFVFFVVIGGIPLEIVPGKEPFYFVIGFLSGFSERLVPFFVHKTQQINSHTGLPE